MGVFFDKFGVDGVMKVEKIMFSPHPSSPPLRSVDATFPAGEGFLGQKITKLVFSILLVLVTSVGIGEPLANLSLPLCRFSGWGTGGAPTQEA